MSGSVTSSTVNVVNEDSNMLLTNPLSNKQVFALRARFLLLYQLLHTLHNIPHILVLDIRPGGQAHAHLEDFLADAIDVVGGVAVHGLLVHGFPHGAGYDVHGVQAHAQGFDVVVGLAVGGGGLGSVDDSGGSGDNGFIGVLLAFHLDIGVKGDGAQPVVAVVLARSGLAVDGHALDAFQQLFVEFLHVLVMGNMVASHSHLPSANAGTDVTHTVIVAYLLVLIVGVALAVLGGVHHNLAPLVFVVGDEGSTTAGGNHLVAVEGEHTILAKGAQHLTVEP